MVMGAMSICSAPVKAATRRSGNAALCAHLRAAVQAGPAERAGAAETVGPAAGPPYALFGAGCGAGLRQNGGSGTALRAARRSVSAVGVQARPPVRVRGPQAAPSARLPSGRRGGKRKTGCCP